MSDEDARERGRKLNRWAWVISVTVFLLVLLMRRYKIDTEIDFSFLPAVYSSINIVTALLLLAAFYFIRVRKNMQAHRQTMQLAVLCSGVFLLLYVVYHFTTAETHYCGVGTWRIVYFVLLISHIILAATILPFILLTYIRGITSQFKRHKRMARWVWPLWLYVAVSGPLVYLMLRPCY